MVVPLEFQVSSACESVSSSSILKNNNNENPSDDDQKGPNGCLKDEWEGAGN